MHPAPNPPDFGAYPIAASHRWLLKITRNCRSGGLDHAVAHGLRRLFILTHAKTVDDTVDGLRCRFHLRDNVCERRFFFTPFYFDHQERQYISEHLPIGGTFVDVGANVGFYSLWAARKAGASGQVLAVEPNPAALERFNCNIGFNPGIARITVVPMGAAEKDENTELHLDNSNLGGSSICTSQAGKRSITVPCAPLADILNKYSIKTIDIMKLDIEGFDLAVLRTFFNQAPAALFPHHLIIERSEALAEPETIASLEKAGYGLALEAKMNTIFRRQP